MTVTTHRLLREDSFFFLLEDESGILLLEVGTLIYEDSSGTNPNDFYDNGSGDGLFLYYLSSQINPDPIYEESNSSGTLYEETSGTNPNEIYEV